jgi:CHAD domain-containing protein
VHLFVLPPTQSLDQLRSALEEAFVVDWGDSEAGRSTFLDTFDWRLFRAGLSLVVIRQKGRPFLRLTGVGEGIPDIPIRRAPEFAGEIPPSPLREAIVPVASIRRLLPRAREKWNTRCACVLDDERKTVVRLAVQTREISPPDSRDWLLGPPLIRVIPLKGYGREAQALRSLLRKGFGLRPSRKGEMALAADALEMTPGLDPSSLVIRLNPEDPGSDAARTIHRALLSIVLSNLDGLRGDLDPEFLHDFRVAIRKTRSALGQIKGVFPPDPVAHFGREFRWLGGRTGPTRDMDVYLLKIPEYREALPGGVRDELEPLVGFLGHKKRLAHRALVRTLGTQRFRRLLQEWEEFLDRSDPPSPEAPNGGRPILRVAKERIWKVYRRVLTDGERASGMGADPPAEALHELRIECKKLRYLIEFFECLFPPAQLQPLRKELKQLQDVLGDFNDLHVQQETLRKLADEMLWTRGGPPETLMAMGRLMGQLETRQEAERMAFRQRYDRFATGRNVKRFRRLFKPGPEGP